MLIEFCKLISLLNDISMSMISLLEIDVISLLFPLDYKLKS